jgi:hypothetical protein
MSSNTPDMVHVGERTFYRGVGMLRYRKSLYSISAHGIDFNSNWIPVMMHYIDSDFITKFRGYGVIHLGIRYLEGEEESEVVFSLNGTKHQLGILHSLRTIQRAVRCMFRRKQAERLTALAMGLHPRLGERSLLSGLCSDLLESITSDCGGKTCDQTPA